MHRIIVIFYSITKKPCYPLQDIGEHRGVAKEALGSATKQTLKGGTRLGDSLRLGRKGLQNIRR